MPKTLFTIGIMAKINHTLIVIKKIEVISNIHYSTCQISTDGTGQNESRVNIQDIQNQSHTLN